MRDGLAQRSSACFPNSVATVVPCPTPAGAVSPAPSFSRALVSDDVELDSIQDSVITDRSRMSGTFTERFSIRFTRSTHVTTADRVEGDQVDRVDLNVDVADGIDASNSNLRPLPEAKGNGDVTCDYPGTQLWTELHCIGDNRTNHAATLSMSSSGRRAERGSASTRMNATANTDALMSSAVLSDCTNVDANT